MDQKELLDKIRHSAEHIEVPESLTAEKMEEKLRQSEGQKKIQRRKIMVRWIEAAAVLALVAAGGTQIGIQKQPGTGNVTEARLQTTQEQTAEEMTAGELQERNTEKENTKEENTNEETTQTEEEQFTDSGTVTGYSQVDSEEELYDALKDCQYQTSYYARGGLGDQVMLLEESAVSDTAASSADTGAVSSSTDYSQTNVREAGVDEGDVVKTDGKYLYILKSDSSVKIVDIQSSEMELVSTVTLDQLNESIEEIYLEDNQLILVTSGYDSSMEEQESDVYAVDRYTYAAVSVYDISDREHPQQTGRMTQEGTYRQSRKNGNYFYLLTQYSPSIGESVDDSDVMPLVNEEKVTVNNIYLPSDLNQPDYLVVSGTDLSDLQNPVSTKAIVSGASDFYMSTDSLYICCQNWEHGKSSTQILKFSCVDGEITASNMAELPGYLNDTFSLDEYDGYLRVLTTEDGNGESNNLFVLDEDMNTISTIRDIASGETIRSARFVGDMGYFVTFRQTDPLFCVDLSEPESPEILSELKISGFSSYLHMYGENRLLGIGYEADEDTGSQTGVKLSMFDISDPENVTEENKYVIKDAYYLPLDYNYKAITIDADKNLIGFVCDGEYMVFRYDEEKGFENLLTYTMSDNNYWDGQESCRGVYVGERFCVVDREKVLMFDMEQDFTLIDRLDWN